MKARYQILDDNFVVRAEYLAQISLDRALRKMTSKTRSSRWALMYYPHCEEPEWAMPADDYLGA